MNEILESIQDRYLEAEQRRRQQAQSRRARRVMIAGLSKRHAMIGNTLAPGVPTPFIYQESWSGA